MSVTKPVPNPVSGFEAYRWPETQALIERLGIDWGALTQNLTITFPTRGPVLVAHDYSGIDRHLSVEENDPTPQERTDP